MRVRAVATSTPEPTDACQMLCASANKHAGPFSPALTEAAVIDVAAKSSILFISRCHSGRADCAADVHMHCE